MNYKQKVENFPSNQVLRNNLLLFHHTIILIHLELYVIIIVIIDFGLHEEPL